MSNKLKILVESGSSSALSNDQELLAKFLGPRPIKERPRQLRSYSDRAHSYRTQAPAYGGAAPMVKRRLAALVLMQVADFSRLLMEDDVATVSAWLAIKRNVPSRSARVHSGRNAMNAPGKMLFEFAGAFAAVQWAISVQRAVERLAMPDGVPKLKLQISVGLDEVIDIEGVPQGHGVNDPNSIIDYATPGGIVMTRAVHDCIKPHLGRLSAAEIDRPTGSVAHSEQCNSLWQLEHS